MKQYHFLTAALSIVFTSAVVTSCDPWDGNPSGNPSAPPSASNIVPPETWKEIWLDHTSDLSRVYYNDEVAIYYDAEISRAITWQHSFMTDVWKYVKSVYGDFGSENRLYAVFHGDIDKYGFIGRTGNIFDEATGHRSLSDVTSNDWTPKSGWNIDAPIHEVGHIVEGSAHGVHESPAFDIWKDSKWAEIFQYDVYRGIGMHDEALRLYDQYTATSESFPNSGTYWFRDWFYPIYDGYGQSKVLNQFFYLLSQYFPKSGQAYARRMNMGEFIHFWSGAAKKDLSGLAKTAFGWSTEWETQLTNAKADFSQFTYSN